MGIRNNSKRIFVLGLGHQKCGTSWLHRYLCQFNFFALGEAKEYHVWDRIDIPIFQKYGSKIKQKLENYPNLYFDYFDNLMSGNKRLTADITPSYSGLKAERLKQIYHKFSSRNIDVKPVILTREPLSRIKSAVRFNLDRKNYSEGININETNFEKALLQYYKTEHCKIRTNYENIISETSKVFNTKNIYIGFYENMFTKSEVCRLSSFLEVSSNFDFTKVYVNKTKNKVIKTEFDLIIKDFYKDTYEYFYQKFPITREIWK